MCVSSFISLWGTCSDEFIRTSQEAFGWGEPGENSIGIFVVEFWLLSRCVFFNSTIILNNAGSGAEGFRFPLM